MTTTSISPTPILEDIDPLGIWQDEIDKLIQSLTDIIGNTLAEIHHKLISGDVQFCESKRGVRQMKSMAGFYRGQRNVDNKITSHQAPRKNKLSKISLT